MKNLEDQIRKALKKLEKYLEPDGGAVELVRCTDDGIVEVRLTGSCAACPLSQFTLRAGIERSLMREFEQIQRVESVK